MQQPQSPESIRYYIDELQKLDRRFDIIWDPKAVQLTAGSYSALGKRIDPTYDGRWAVILYDNPDLGHTGFHPERGWTLWGYVTEYTIIDGVRYMIRDGAYAPIDDRLLEFVRAADAGNVDEFKELRRRVWKHHDQVEAAERRIDEGMAREGLDRVHFKANYAGSVGNWQGKGADFAAMAEAARTRRALASILGAAR
jgi:hypothetical protein